MKKKRSTTPKRLPVRHGDVKQVAKMFNITENTVRARYAKSDKQIVQAFVDIQRKREAEKEEVERLKQLLDAHV